MTELGLTYVVHNPRTAAGEVQNEQSHEMLQSVGGKDSIPFLIDRNEEKMTYESEDIVEYLEDQYG